MRVQKSPCKNQRAVTLPQSGSWLSKDYKLMVAQTREYENKKGNSKMKKTRKMFTIIVAVVLVFAFTTTVFAATLVDSETWLGANCINYFQTTGYVLKGTVDRWDTVNIGIYGYSFASPATNDWLTANPRNSAGTLIGETVEIPNYNELPSTILRNYNNTSKVYLRITNPNPGNNMYSHGFWEGYIK